MQAKSIENGDITLSPQFYQKYLEATLAALYTFAVQGRPQAITKLTIGEYEDFVATGDAALSRNIKTSVAYGYQVLVSNGELSACVTLMLST